MPNKKHIFKLNKRAVLTLRSVSGQIACVALPLMLFFIGADIAVKRNGSGSTPLGIICTLFASAVFIISFCIWLSLQLTTVDISQRLEESRPLLLLLAISLLLRLPQLGTIPFQDYAVYYGALMQLCDAFQLTPAYMLESMRLASHPSYVYTLFAAIPEFFFPGNANNVWLIQTILSLLVLSGIYRILTNTVGLKKPAAFIGVMLVSCYPFFLGLVAYLQLDFATAVFFFLFLWAFLDRKLILTVVLAGGLVLTKEFGIVLLVGFIIGVMLYYLICTKGGFVTRFMAILHDVRMALLLIISLAGGLVMIYYLFFSSKAWIDIAAVFNNEGTTRLGYIGFDAEYIVHKLVQLLVMNFIWLIVLLIAVGILFGIISKNKHYLPAETVLLIYGCVNAMFLYMVFSCLMVTYTVPRYNIVVCMILVLLAAIVLLFNLNAQAGVCVCTAVSVLLTVQSYLTIDPVMKAIYVPIRTGTVNMIYTNSIGDPFIGDYAVYNYQYSFMTKALRQILEDQNYDGTADVMCVGLGTNLYFGTQNYYGWNPEKKQITFRDSDSICIPISSTGYEDAYIEPELSSLKKDKAIFVFIPESRSVEEVYANFSTNPSLSGRYTNLEPHVASGGIGGKLYYWTADRI